MDIYTPEFALETSTTTGTGAYALAGAPASTAYRAFMEHVATGKKVFYCARSLTTMKWEMGWGTVTDSAPDTLSRNVIKSFDGVAIGTAAVDWQLSDGTITIYATIPGAVIDGTRINHRGATAPAWAEDGMIWEDTSGGATATLLKLRGNGAWITLGTVNETAGTFAPSTTGLRAQGRSTLSVNARDMIPRTTNGPATGSSEMAAGAKVMQVGLDFDQATNEHAQFYWLPPKSWDRGTVTAEFVWTTAASSGSVIWGLRGYALSDDDAMDLAALGTAQVVTDAFIAAADVHRSGETAAITIGGTPATGDLVLFEAYRDAAAGGDTLNGDARLLGVRIFFTTNAATDA